MDRRTFLATATATTGIATAGCSDLLGGTVSLADPETEIQDEGEEKYLKYSHDGENVVTVGFDQRRVPAALDERFGLRISMTHGEDTTIESLQFDLRAPRTSVDPPAEIYLKAPGSRWPNFTFEGVEDLWTRIGIADVGELGEGTMLLETIVDPIGTRATEIGARIEMELSGPRSYSLDTTTEFEPVTQ